MMSSSKKMLSNVSNKPTVKPKPIVAKELIEDVPLRECFLGILKDKKTTAIVIKKLSTILPGFGYLKRCSQNRIFLTFVADVEKNKTDLTFSNGDELKNYLRENNFDLNLLEDNLIILPLPGRQPKTKLQAKNASKIWPINFHPDVYIESILGGNYFNSYQLNVIEYCMRVCIEAAQKESTGNDFCNGSALILDPTSDDPSKILALATARTNEHPMWHAAMLAIDLVAKLNGGGIWKLNHEDIDIKTQDDSLEKNVNNRKRKINHGNLPLSYPKNLNALVIFSEYAYFSENKVSLTSLADNSDDCTDKNIPYLCTNYWVFLIQEPCSLCAMALLHSRVSMIFYGAPNKSCGSLESRSLLHTLPGLNHRYKVWSGILEDECQKVMRDLSQSE